MSKRRKITRRDFLRVSALTTAGAVAAACGGPATEEVVEPPEVEEEVPEVEEPEVEEEASEPTAAPSESGYSEAPSLAALVEAGELPPVDERLPLEPFVVGPGVLVAEEELPDWEVGSYGGSLGHWGYPWFNLQEDFLMSPAHHITPINGNLCSQWSVNDEATEYEFTLRRGLKWSDGEAVTIEDIRFVWEDVLMNEQLTPVVGANFRAGGRPDGEPMELEIVDDFTFRITFAEPYGRFLREMGAGGIWSSASNLLKPSHYLKQFHEDYAPEEELELELEEEGLSSGEWHRLFHSKDSPGGQLMNPSAIPYPTLAGWQRIESPETRREVERNPYYFKVDTEGNQLPYIDNWAEHLPESPDAIPMMVIAGDVNFTIYKVTHDQLSFFTEHEEEGGYKVNLGLTYHNAPVAFFLNYNNPDPVWQEVVLNKKFRHAINAAIDNEEILEVLFYGMGTTSPWIPDVDDPEEANRLLDEIGLDQRDNEGWRLGPDGERFEIFLEVQSQPLFLQSAELVTEHLQAVGLRTSFKEISGELWAQRRDANELYASIQWLDDCNWPYIVWDYMPTHRIAWGQKWHDWIQSEGAEGMEPPDWIMELYDIDAELRAVNPATARADLAEQRFADWMLEYIPVFPMTRDVADVMIVPPNLGNFQRSGRSSSPWLTEEQLFLKQG